MDFEFEKIMAKISGNNAETFTKDIMSDEDKKQIQFAFEQIFTGQTILQWISANIKLMDAWNISMDKLRSYIFAINIESPIVKYMQIAVSEYKIKELRKLNASIHSGEFYNGNVTESNKLENSANLKISTGVQIIQQLIMNSNNFNVQDTNINKTKINVNIREKENVRERKK